MSPLDSFIDRVIWVCMCSDGRSDDYLASAIDSVENLVNRAPFFESLTYAAACAVTDVRRGAISRHEGDHQ